MDIRGIRLRAGEDAYRGDGLSDPLIRSPKPRAQSFSTLRLERASCGTGLDPLPSQAGGVPIQWLRSVFNATHPDKLPENGQQDRTRAGLD